MTTHFMHLDPTLFPEPYKFDPERWLGPSIGLDRLEQYVVPFSKGSRACIGLQYVLIAGICPRALLTAS